MFKKEIKKIKDLINKLKTEGDVTEDEADWLYVAKSVLFATYSQSASSSVTSPSVLSLFFRSVIFLISFLNISISYLIMSTHSSSSTASFLFSGKNCEMWDFTSFLK